MKTATVKPFFSVFGVKKRARKVDRHTKELRDMSVEQFEAAKPLLLKAFHNHINQDFRSVGSASFSYWPGEYDDETGMSTFRPFSSVTVESIEARKP